MAEYKHIRVEKRDGRADIILNREPVNILNIEMMSEIAGALGTLAADDELRALVLRSNLKVFSAGVDVGEHTAEKVDEMIRGFETMFKRLWSVRAVTIAAVNGAALGGGCELAIGCDIVVASEKAKLGQPEIQVGVFAPVAVALLPRLIGRNHAVEWLCNGNVMTAGEAARIHLVNRVFPVEGFEEKVDRFVEGFTAQSAAVIALTRRAIDETWDKPFAEGAEIADDIYLDTLMKTEDAHEGLAAFLAKRKPVWKHK